MLYQGCKGKGKEEKREGKRMEGGSGKERREDRTKRVTIGVRWRKLRGGRGKESER